MSMIISGSGGATFPDSTTQTTAATTATPFTITGNSTAGAELRLPEDTDNGSNYVALKAADSIASNVTFTLPSADGTSGQVIQTNGSGVLSFATPAGGAWTYLSTVSASGAATADVESTFSSTYDQYAIIGSGISISNAGQNFQIRLKIGGSYITTSTYGYCYRFITGYNTTEYPGSSDDAASEIRFCESLSSSTSKTSNFIVYVSNPASTTMVKNIFWESQFSYDTPNQSIIYCAGAARNTNTGALTGVRFFPSAGTLSGTFRLYGIKNS